MADYRVLRDAQSKAVILRRVRWCASFLCHLRGLMFAADLPEDEGLLFVTNYEGRTHTTIHMFFMRFSIAVIWLDNAGKVVDAQLAKPWRPAYAPKQAAQYYLEANVSLLDRVTIGDVLRFDERAE
ncbi:MAG: DUF192 domain-containing protein [Chloroflexota bacterium]|nr:DUF192 domain-containing protein [Chloroflexota bacterium]